MSHRRYGVVLAILVAVAGVTTTAAAGPTGAARPITFVGPIPTTATSHHFNVSAIDLAGHGYVEEEFFLRGKANVYDYDAAGRVVVTRSGAPYENRIIVRRPADRRDFSGTVVVELMNMTNRWDLDRMWLTSHDQYMRDGTAGGLGVDGVVGDRLAAVVADQVDLDRLAAGVSAGEGGGVHRPFVAPLRKGEHDRNS